MVGFPVPGLSWARDGGLESDGLDPGVEGEEVDEAEAEVEEEVEEGVWLVSVVERRPALNNEVGLARATGTEGVRLLRVTEGERDVSSGGKDEVLVLANFVDVLDVEPVDGAGIGGVDSTFPTPFEAVTLLLLLILLRDVPDFRFESFVVGSVVVVVFVDLLFVVGSGGSIPAFFLAVLWRWY